MAFGDFFIWTVLASFFIGGMNMNFMLVNWIWETFLNPNSYGLIFFMILISLIIEDDDRVIWPLPFLYFYMIWSYNHFTTTMIMSYIGTYWMQFMFYTLGYLVVGFVWSIVKLQLFVSSDKYNKQIHTSLGQGKWESKNKSAEDIVSENKFRIFGWIVYWPLSVINYVSYDMILNLYNLLFNNFFSRVYIYVVKMVLNRIAKEDSNDQEKPVEKPIEKRSVRSVSPARS